MPPQRINRPGLPPPRRGPAHAGPQTLLEQARRWMNNGDYHRASVAFEKLAREAERLAPVRSPLMYFQAGRCRVLMGDPESGLGLIYRALNALALQGRWPEFRRSAQTTISELRDSGALAQAEALQTWLEQKSASAPATLPGDVGPVHENSQLPLNCPNCGAPLLAKDLEWVDASTVVCNFCGGLVRPQ